MPQKQVYIVTALCLTTFLLGVHYGRYRAISDMGTVLSAEALYYAAAFDANRD